MKWLFYLISIASVVLSGSTLGMMASDIQLIIAVQFASLAVLSFGVARILAALGRADQDKPQAS